VFVLLFPFYGWGDGNQATKQLARSRQVQIRSGTGTDLQATSTVLFESYYPCGCGTRCCGGLRHRAVDRSLRCSRLRDRGVAYSGAQGVGGSAHVNLVAAVGSCHSTGRRWCFHTACSIRDGANLTYPTILDQVPDWLLMGYSRPTVNGRDARWIRTAQALADFDQKIVDAAGASGLISAFIFLLSHCAGMSSSTQPTSCNPTATRRCRWRSSTSSSTAILSWGSLRAGALAGRCRGHSLCVLRRTLMFRPMTGASGVGARDRSKNQEEGSWLHILVLGADGMSPQIDRADVRDGRLGKRRYHRMDAQDVVARRRQSGICRDMWPATSQWQASPKSWLADGPDVVFSLAAIVSGESRARFRTGLIRINTRRHAECCSTPSAYGEVTNPGWSSRRR